MSYKETECRKCGAKYGPFYKSKDCFHCQSVGTVEIDAPQVGVGCAALVDADATIARMAEAIVEIEFVGRHTWNTCMQTARDRATMQARKCYEIAKASTDQEEQSQPGTRSATQGGK